MSFGVFQFRRGTASQWTSSNPVLLSGELGLETDTSQFKIGNGTSNWTALSYGGIKGDSGATGSTGQTGATGNNGWSPILAVVSDGERRVLQVSDWSGGSGTKPATGSFIGVSGFVATAAQAVDIRGATGATGAAGSNGVTAFNGRTGSVTPQQADYDAFFTTPAEAAAAAPVQSVNGQTGAVTIGTAAPRILPAAKGFVSSTAEQIIARWAIPANTFNNAVDAFKVVAGIQAAGAGTFIYRLRVGAAGTVADTQVAILTTSAAQAANAYHTVQFQGGFHAATNAIRANGFGVLQAVVLGTITAAATTATVNPAAVVHVSITCTTATAQVATVIGPCLLIGGE